MKMKFQKTFFKYFEVKFSEIRQKSENLHPWFMYKKSSSLKKSVGPLALEINIRTPRPWRRNVNTFFNVYVLPTEISRGLLGP